MDLQTNLAHLRGKKVQIGMKHYDVDVLGVIHGVDDKHAKELLAHAGGAWVPYHPPKTGTPQVRKPERTPFKVNFAAPPKDETSLAGGPTRDMPLEDLSKSDFTPPYGTDVSGEPSHDDTDGDTYLDATDDTADAHDAPHDPTAPLAPGGKKRRRRK